MTNGTLTTARVWRTRLFRIGSWCFVVMGLGHLLIQLMLQLTARPAAVQRVLDEMAHTSFRPLVLDRNWGQLFYGFSITMGLSILCYGTLNLVVASRARHLVAEGRLVPAMNLALSALALVVSMLALPEPPIALLAIATVAFATSLFVRSTSESETVATAQVSG